MEQTEQTESREVWYVEYTHGVEYFTLGDGWVTNKNGVRVTMPQMKFLDFIHTARELGFRAGKV